MGVIFINKMNLIYNQHWLPNKFQTNDLFRIQWLKNVADLGKFILSINLHNNLIEMRNDWKEYYKFDFRNNN